MHKHVSVCLCLVLCLVFSSCSKSKRTEGEDTFLKREAKPLPNKITALPEKYIFPARAETIVSIPGTKEVKLSWRANLTAEEYERCKNFAIKAESETGGSVAAPRGGIKVAPVHGEIRVKLINMENFPIEVEIYLGNAH